MSLRPCAYTPTFLLAAALLCGTAGVRAETPTPPATFAPPATPAYNWKPGDVLRFDYNRTITTVAENGDAPKEHLFAFSGVLIIEIKARVKDPIKGETFKGFLRFDAPQVQMPESYLFQSVNDEPQLEKDKAKQMDHAIEGAIKAQRWDVTLDKQGAVTIDARQKPTEEWLREESKTGGWRSRFNKYWIDLLENQLGLKGSGDEREIFLCLAPPPVTAPNALTPIRPVRSQPKLERVDDCKAVLSFIRLAPPAAELAKGYEFTSLGAPTVSMTLKPEVLTSKGTASFDLTLGLLDKLEEDYSFKLDYSCLPDRLKITLQQTVLVSYALKRLAPAIRACDEPVLRGP